MSYVSYLVGRFFASLQDRFEAHAALGREFGDGSPVRPGVFDQPTTRYWELQSALGAAGSRVHMTLLLLALVRTNDEAYKNALLECMVATGTRGRDVQMSVYRLENFLRSKEDHSLRLEVRTLLYFITLGDDTSQESLDPEHQWFLAPDPVTPVASPVPVVVPTRYQRLKATSGSEDEIRTPPIGCPLGER